MNPLYYKLCSPSSSKKLPLKSPSSIRPYEFCELKILFINELISLKAKTSAIGGFGTKSWPWFETRLLVQRSSSIYFSNKTRANEIHSMDVEIHLTSLLDSLLKLEQDLFTYNWRLISLIRVITEEHENWLDESKSQVFRQLVSWFPNTIPKLLSADL